MILWTVAFSITANGTVFGTVWNNRYCMFSPNSHGYFRSDVILLVLLFLFVFWRVSNPNDNTVGFFIALHFFFLVVCVFNVVVTIIVIFSMRMMEDDYHYHHVLIIAIIIGLLLFSPQYQLIRITIIALIIDIIIVITTTTTVAKTIYIFIIIITLYQSWSLCYYCHRHHNSEITLSI